MRFFNREQRQIRADEIGGYHSEIVDENGIPYPGRIEAHHIDKYHDGGKTEIENMLLVDIVSHAILHLISDDPYSFRRVVSRMTPEEKEELHRRGY
jgi:hypothetical protein